MIATLFQEFKSELQKGVHKKGHPFRYCTMGTVNSDHNTRMRTVVLRRIEEDLNLLFYTDKRSKKILHINENPEVCLLFYHPKKLLQLRIDGPARIIADKNTLRQYWNGVQPSSRKDYTSILAPGTTISNPDAIEYLDDYNNFRMIKVVPEKIEYLKLKRPNHLRVSYTMQENEWEGTFIVP